MECAVIVPVLARPDSVAPLVRSFYNSRADARLYFVADEEDYDEVTAIRSVMADYDDVELILTDQSNIDENYGWMPTTFAQKVNIGVKHTAEPWLLFIGDDVTFSRHWLENALKAAAHSGRRFVSTNDMANPHVRSGLHCIHPMVRRDYIEQVGVTFDGKPGVLACEEYRHSYVDNEWTVKARHDEEYIFAYDAIVRHHHPIFNPSVKSDATYKRGMETAALDAATYRRRLSRYLLNNQSKTTH